MTKERQLEFTMALSDIVDCIIDINETGKANEGSLVRIRENLIDLAEDLEKS